MDKYKGGYRGARTRGDYRGTRTRRDYRGTGGQEGNGRGPYGCGQYGGK